MPSSPEATTRVNANRTVAREGRKSLSAPTSSNDGTVRPGGARDFRPCATNRPAVSAAVMTERRSATVQDREILEGQGSRRGALGRLRADRRRRRVQGIPPKHHAAVRVVDRLAAPKARSSTEPSALGRHPSIVDVP
jgi:hypothetical protein